MYFETCHCLLAVLYRPGTEGSLMRTEYTAAVKRDGDWWIGRVKEVPGVNCQERSFEELKETLRETLKEALESN